MTASSAYYASQLRHELSLRNRAFALQTALARGELWRNGGDGLPTAPHPAEARQLLR